MCVCVCVCVWVYVCVSEQSIQRVFDISHARYNVPSALVQVLLCYLRVLKKARVDDVSMQWLQSLPGRRLQLR